MGYVLADLFMIAVEIYFWCKGEKKPPPKEKPLPKIVMCRLRGIRRAIGSPPAVGRIEPKV